VSRVGWDLYPCEAVELGPRHWIRARERMQGARRRPWRAPRTSRATPQTPLSQPTLRTLADFPSFIVVASLLGLRPTASAPPRL